MLEGPGAVRQEQWVMISRLKTSRCRGSSGAAESIAMDNPKGESRYQRWLLTLVDHRQEGATPGAWVATTFVVLVILVLCSWVEPIAGWFQLPFWTALACYAPSFVFGFVGTLFERAGTLSLQVFGALQLVNTVLLQFFMAALVSLSSPPGSFALTSCLIITAAYHGYILRGAPRHPYIAFGTVLALAAAYALNPTPESSAVLGFLAPTGVLLSLLLGRMGLKEHADRAERDKLRQAIYYRTLNETAQETERVSRKVVRLLGHNHDAGNLLSTVFLSAQLLEEGLASSQQLPPDLHEHAKEHLVRLTSQLENLKTLIQRAQALSEDPISMKETPVYEVVQEAVRDYRALYPGVAIELEVEGGAESRVRVHDGRLGLRRILDNVIQNACEGDGTRAARRVRVVVSTRAETVEVCCVDDGPGFRPDQLHAPPVPFHTTKAGGHGLGLFNVSHLVQASGGAFRLRNAEQQGAVVEIQLLAAS